MVGVHSFSVLAAISLVVPYTSSASLIQPTSLNIQSRQNDYFVVAPVLDGGVQPRLNIRDLERKPENQELWTLFLLALQRLKVMDQSEKTSFYQIAGIHGQPWVPWDNVPSWSSDPLWGYCPHNGHLFAPWHRPYMMIYEQLLHTHARAIVDEIKDTATKTRYREAASKLRIPFWDWAEKPPAGEHVLPSSVADETISITYPNGTTVVIENPLFQYRFSPLNSSAFPWDGTQPYNTWNHTFRLPQPAESVDPVDNKAGILEVLDGNLGNARDGLFKILKSYQSFNKFSNSMSGYDIRIGNLENVHNTIHNSFRWGHMYFSTVASFDPVFFLHHANVDRHIALFQALYPETYVDPQRSVYQTTFTLDSSSPDPTDGDTPLMPFHRNSAGDFWTSNLVRDTTKLGYTYPELVGKPSNDTLKAAIKALYDDSATTTALVTREQSRGLNEPNVNQTSRDYNVLIGMPVGYTAGVFLGEAGSDPSTWPTEKNYVGAFSTTFNVGMGVGDSALNGIVGLSASLAQAHADGQLSDVDESTVVQFLKKELKWKVASFDGKEVPTTEVPKFSIEVFSQLQTVPMSESEFPAVVSEKTYLEITSSA